MAEFLTFHLDPEKEHPRKRIGLILTFKNAEGNRYYSKVETGVGGLFVSPAKRLNLFGKLYLTYRNGCEKALLGWQKLLWMFQKPHIEQPKRKK